MSDYLLISMIIFFLGALFIIVGLNYSAFFIIILFTMFLENSIFMIPENSIIPFNLRPIYIVTLISLVYLIPQLLLNFKSKFTLLKHHKILLLYSFYCTIMLIIVPTYYSIEHFGQIGIGIFLYFCFLILSRERNFSLLYNILLLVGFLQLVSGLFQVIFGILTVENIIDLGYYTQHLDLVKYGRPFGSLVEPDFFGAIATFFAFIFVGEYINRKKYIYYFAGFFFFLILFYSAVRASIIGFFVSLIFILFLLKDKIKVSRVDGIIAIYSCILLVPVFYSTIQRFGYLLRLDFWSEGFMNPRLLQMGVSFSQFLENPIFGNGLNAYRFLEDSYSDLIEDWMPDWVISGYDPSIITSLLNDTGLVGFSLFASFIFFYFKYLLSQYNIKNIFSIAAILSLLISYIFTNGLPFTFTWVLLAMIELKTKFTNESSNEI